MADLVGAEGDYAARCGTLMDSRIALWDVLSNSVRPGSMDADINMATAQANDFGDFLARHADIELICFNGQKAAQLFSRFVERDRNCGSPRRETLPSTSPAYAAMSYAEKRQNWLAAITIVSTAGD